MEQNFEYDKRHMPFGHAVAINDTEVLTYISNMHIDILSVCDDKFISNQFLNNYKSWITSSKLNIFKGLENFKYACFANGTTEAFEKFYHKNSTRRFRCFKGEYLYHKLAWRNTHNWKWLEEDSIKEQDAVIISLPFSNTGNKHIDHDSVIRQCEDLNVPVLIDCAYLGICSNIDFDLSFNCITDVTFSLSKTFPVAHARIGMRLTKHDDDDILFVTNKSDYINRISCFIGNAVINEFSPDYIPNKYRDKQIEICKKLNIQPSNTVLFGNADIDKFIDYNRGGNSNRLGLHKFLNRPIEELDGYIN